MTGNLLAIGFYTPWMLTGILLASLPVIIHYWFRRNYQVTEWAAVQFLLSAVQKHSKRIRLEQIILLTIRFLILALISFAMAEPFLSGGQQDARSGGSVHRVLVLDASYSMGKRDFKNTHFEKAKTIAREIVNQSAKEDFLSLFQISSVSPVSIIPKPTLFHETVKRELDRTEVTEESGDLANVIQELNQSIRDHSKSQKCEVIFISDLQKSLWNPIPDLKQKELNQQLDLLGQVCSLRIIDVGDEKLSNLAVTSLEQDDSFVVVDRPASFSVKVRNFGQQSVKEQFVELYVNGHLADSAQIDIPAGQDQVISFSHVFAFQGQHQLEVRMADDLLPADQKRWLAVNVQKGLKVLLVNGREADNPSNRATFYLETVLSPKVTSGDLTGLFDVDSVSMADWNRVDLKQYDAVFVVDVPDFQKEEASKLRQYVAEGGGLILCMGNQVDLLNYNQWKLKSEAGDGFLPVELLGRAKTNQGDQAFYFLPEDLSHPILKPFEGNPGTGLESTVVLDYIKLKVIPDISTKIPLRYDSGDPVFTETSFEKGKIFVLTTSVDLSWGTWAVQPGFPPLVYELVKYAVSGRWKKSELKVGELVQIRLPDLNEGTSVSITLPDGSKVNSILANLQGKSGQEQAGILFSRTDQAGVYQVFSNEKKLLNQFAVNLESTESDLRRIPFERIKNQLSVETELTYTKDWQPEKGILTSGIEMKTGINQGIMILVLCLFFVELLMSWKFSYGLGLLTFFGLLAFIGTVYQYQAVLGWGIFVIAVIVILFVNRGRILSRAEKLR